MPTLPTTLPFPDPGIDSQIFWENCRNKTLKFQACGDCGVLRHPPVPLCPTCQSTAQIWLEAPPRGRVFTYTVVHYASHPDVADCLPYLVVLVEFPEMPGVRLISNLTGVPPDEINIGMEVELFWDEGPTDMWLPRYRIPLNSSINTSLM